MQRFLTRLPLKTGIPLQPWIYRGASPIVQGSRKWTREAARVAPLATQSRMRLKDPPRDPFVNAVKYFALCLLAIGCLKVYPYVGEFTLIHSVGLLDSEDPFFVKIGLSRLRTMIYTENGAKRVVEASAVQKCRTLLSPKSDPNLIPMILDVLEVLSAYDVSRPYLQQEGILEWIERGIQEQWIDAEVCHRQLKTLKWELIRH